MNTSAQLSGCVYRDGDRVLVTGGSGFIGTNLVVDLHARGVNVMNIDIAAPKIAAHQPFWQLQDIRDRAGVMDAVARFDPHYVFHLAARTDLNGRQIGDYDANTDGVRHMIDACTGRANLRRAVFVSSRLVCKIGYQPTADDDYNGDSVYGQSKAEGEKIVRASGAGRFDWVILRPTSIWGPWFGVPYRDFFDVLKRGHYVHPGTEPIRKSYGYIGNTVYQMHQVAGYRGAQQLSGRTFYLCDDQPLELYEWACQINQCVNRRPPCRVPRQMLYLLACCGDLLAAAGWKSVPLTRFRLDNICTDMVHDTADMARICGPLPYGWRDGVRETVQWMADHD